ncbi:uncharacterized protein LOC129591737 [Paramacrobiotus metropolitanus]|uniref:uncharacterized protein LOC129591737 n=1 Tax=Paramacrobiotus metropolitanus TaxID=2943436 RepID=UPI002445B77F|nr:uncharacterized protein LOC129591737 [Paramacrobiotus metropolitanus]XP_055343492.1 uncharacterized protein LOC129591737 [Paramacrobiotus metropolitanus]
MPDGHARMLAEMGGTKSPDAEPCCPDMDEDAADSLLDGAECKCPVASYGSVSLETLVELEAVVAAEHVFQRLQTASHESPAQALLQPHADTLENGMRHFCRAFVRRFTELAGGTRSGSSSDRGGMLEEAPQRLLLPSPEEALGWDCGMEQQRSPTPHTTQSPHRFGLEDSQSNASDMSSASAPRPLSALHADNFQEIDTVDGDVLEAPVQVRSKSNDCSPGQKSSFLRRMSFKTLTQSFNPFGKRHSQERKPTLTRVPTSGSLPISENGPVGRIGDGVGRKDVAQDAAAWGGSTGIRPRLASAPAAELARIRPVKYSGAATGPISSAEPAEALSSASSLYNLAPTRSNQRKGSLTGSSLSSGRQSPVSVGAVPPAPIPEHDTLKKRDEDLASLLGYHADISRAQAAGLVQQGGHGAFLVRASETDPGKFVLTFNGQGRPKHLRFCIQDDGRCRVQSAWFESLAEMVMFYRANPIPSETGHCSDATLTLMISRDLPPVPQAVAVATEPRQRSYTSPFAPEAIAAARKTSADPVRLPAPAEYRGGAAELALVRKDIKGVY